MKLLTTREVAERLGILVRSVASAARKGALPGARLVDGYWVIPESAVDYYLTHHLGSVGRHKGQKTSPVRRVVELRMMRVGCLRAPELASELEVTPQLITVYLREIGARFDRQARRWYPPAAA